MESSSTPGAAPADGPDLVFLSRDGRIRTDDLSVPNAGLSLCGGLLWTKAQVTWAGATQVNPHSWLRTRDKRGMEGWPASPGHQATIPVFFCADETGWCPPNTDQ